MYQCSLPASFRNVQSSFSGTFLLFVHFDPHLLFKFVSLFAKSFICNVYYLVPYKFSKVCLLLINCVWKKQKRTRITSQQMVKKIVRWGGRRINRTLWEGEKDTNGSPLCQDSGSHSESLLKLELLILSLRVSDRSSRHPKLCDKMGRNLFSHPFPIASEGTATCLEQPTFSSSWVMKTCSMWKEMEYEIRAGKSRKDDPVHLFISLEFREWQGVVELESGDVTQLKWNVWFPANKSWEEYYRFINIFWQISKNMCWFTISFL